MNTQPSPLDQILKSKFWPAAWGAFGRAFTSLGLALLGWLVERTPPRPHRALNPEHCHYSLMELCLILAAFGDRRNVLTWAENPVLRWVGLGLYLIAAFYFLWANLTWSRHTRRVLGNALDDPVLLTEGPYRWSRYPILLGILLYSLGFALAFRSWAGLVFLIPLIWVILRRAKPWDEMYAKEYKHAWAVRSQTSKRLIPFLYKN